MMSREPLSSAGRAGGDPVLQLAHLLGGDLAEQVGDVETEAFLHAPVGLADAEVAAALEQGLQFLQRHGPAAALGRVVVVREAQLHAAGLLAGLGPRGIRPPRRGVLFPLAAVEVLEGIDHGGTAHLDEG